MTQSNLLTPKEINFIVRSIKGDQFEYRTFSTLLYDIRFELAKSRLMDTNIDKLQEHLIEEFSRLDHNQSGKISILDIQRVLLDSKKVNLTPFQIQIIIGQSNPDENGLVNYKEFSFKCKEYITELFSMKSLAEKASLIQQGAFKPAENLEEINLSKLDLFKVNFFLY